MPPRVARVQEGGHNHRLDKRVGSAAAVWHRRCEAAATARWPPCGAGQPQARGDLAQRTCSHQCVVCSLLGFCALTQAVMVALRPCIVGLASLVMNTLLYATIQLKSGG